MLHYDYIKRADPRDLNQPKKWYIKPVYSGRINIANISSDIAMASSLSRGDVMNVMLTMSEQVPRYLLDGKSVQLGEIGTLRISFSSGGRDDAEELNTSMINNVKLIFTPSRELKEILKKVKFKRED
jgi:predicted histone-like DNA-binding protein